MFAASMSTFSGVPTSQVTGQPRVPQCEVVELHGRWLTLRREEQRWSWALAVPRSVGPRSDSDVSGPGCLRCCHGGAAPSLGSTRRHGPRRFPGRSPRLKRPPSRGRGTCSGRSRIFSSGLSTRQRLGHGHAVNSGGIASHRQRGDAVCGTRNDDSQTSGHFVVMFRDIVGKSQEVTPSHPQE